MLRPFLRLLLTFVILATWMPGVEAAFEPRPITAQERYAVQMIADALGRGPEAILDRLTDDHPFRHLPRAEALDAIEARTGPMEGAAWTLATHRDPARRAIFQVEFPSGLDELIVFELVGEGDAIRVAQLRCGAEPGTRPVHGGPLPVIDSENLRRQWPRGFWPLGAFLALLMVGLTIEPSSFARKLARLFALSSSLVLLVIQVNVLTNDMPPGDVVRSALEPNEGDSSEPMAQLIDYRRAMAEHLNATPPSEVPTGTEETIRVWQAGLALTQGDRARAQDLLGQSDVPLATLLRARLSRGGYREMATLYQAAYAASHESDLVLAEALNQLPTAANTQLATVLAQRGSRQATPYYLLSFDHFSKGKAREARQAFNTAWMLEPLPKSTLVILDFMMPVLDDPGLSGLVALSSPEEPVVRDAKLAGSPIDVPDHSRAEASGALLRMEIGSSTLVVPGGASIAPRKTVPVPAAYWEERDDRDSLADAERILEENVRFSATPRNQRRFTRAAEALSNHNRWSEVVRLTASLQPDGDEASLELLVFRANALIRSGESGEARSLLQSTWIDDVVSAPGNHRFKFTVAELLSQVDSLGEAIEIYRSNSFGAEASDPIKIRARKLELQWGLSHLGPLHLTEHFEIHGSPEISEALAQRIGTLLEAELQRLGPMLGVRDFAPTEVNVLAWDDFRYNVTGSDWVVGIYDGRITFPFATIGRFKPEVIAILTHELTHAIVAQGSKDNAPRWFQEGVAQRHELLASKGNVFTLTPPDDVIPFELIDLVLAHSEDPILQSRSYSLALATIMFLEDQYGRDFPARMIKSYAQGANTKDVVSALTGKTVADVDGEFRTWARKHRDPFVDDRPYPYHSLYGLDVDPDLRSRIRLTNPKPNR